MSAGFQKEEKAPEAPEDIEGMGGTGGDGHTGLSGRSSSGHIFDTPVVCITALFTTARTQKQPAFPRNPRGRLGFPGPTPGEG